MEAWMPARAGKTSDRATTTVRLRRGTRPRSATAAARIYQLLRGELISLQRKPGDAISEAEIALANGVSRTPVREAILKLADDGLVDIFPQSGICVSRIPMAALPEAILVRKALEETTARLAAERATSSQVMALHAIVERQREANVASDNEAFHQADELFHATVAEVARHPGIWTLIQQVKIHVDRYRRLTLPQEGRIARAIGEHEAILEGIESRDAARARSAMEAHLERLLRDISATQNINPDFFEP
jgi:DNA-binding GntR family transcriptional regulator